MISVSQAKAFIEEHRPDYKSRRAALHQALGMRCAEDVHAKVTVPPFDASAMDGYAALLNDTKRGTVLKVIGEAPAGSPFSGKINPGECVRIFTGGPLPDGADTIIIQENVTRDGNTITIDLGMDTARHIRRAGIDFKRGEKLLSKDQAIGPAEITLAAAGNHDTLKINRPLTVAILANGDELRPPGSDLAPGQIVSSNSPGLWALVKAWGGEPMDLGIADDSLDTITSLIQSAKDADIIVPVGGASVGDYDLMKQAFEAMGYEQIFSKIAVRPGKPTWFGKLGEQCVLGLPGNPASAAVCAHLFLRPLITDPIHGVPARLDTGLDANGPRETYIRGKIAIKSGCLEAHPFPRQDSSLISPLAASNALIKLPPESGPWNAGDQVDVLPLGMGPAVL